MTGAVFRLAWGRPSYLTRLFNHINEVKLSRNMNLTSHAVCPGELIDGQSSTRSRQLVAMRHAGKGKPLFCIHPSGGDIGIYRKLASRIGPELSVMGIQSRLMCGAESEFSNLEEMAFDYACLVKEHQPVGAIRLLGFSLGGFLASLMARELQQAGRSVAFLGLIDSDPNWTTATETSRQELCLRLTQVFTKFQSIGVMREKPLEIVQRDVAILVNSCMGNHHISPTEVMANTIAMGYVPSRQKDSDLLLKFTNTFLTHCRLLKDFKPPIVNCPLYLWWPSEATPDESQPWASKANLTVSESVIEGSHFSIMRGAAVRNLAEELEAAIAHEDALATRNHASRA